MSSALVPPHICVQLCVSHGREYEKTRYTVQRLPGHSSPLDDQQSRAITKLVLDACQATNLVCAGIHSSVRRLSLRRRTMGDRRTCSPFTLCASYKMVDPITMRRIISPTRKLVNRNFANTEHWNWLNWHAVL